MKIFFVLVFEIISGILFSVGIWGTVFAMNQNFDGGIIICGFVFAASFLANKLAYLLIDD